MLVLISTAASRYYNCCTGDSASLENYGSESAKFLLRRQFMPAVLESTVFSDEESHN
jgi:hypothetical protein